MRRLILILMAIIIAQGSALAVDTALWKTETWDDIDPLSIKLAGENVFFLGKYAYDRTHEWYLISVDSETGKHIWRFPLEGKCPWELGGNFALVKEGNNIYFLGSKVKCLDFSTGEERWSVDINMVDPLLQRRARFGGLWQPFDINATVLEDFLVIYGSKRGGWLGLSMVERVTVVDNFTGKVILEQEDPISFRVVGDKVLIATRDQALSMDLSDLSISILGKIDVDEYPVIFGRTAEGLFILDYEYYNRKGEVLSKNDALWFLSPDSFSCLAELEGGGKKGMFGLIYDSGYARWDPELFIDLSDKSFSEISILYVEDYIIKLRPLESPDPTWTVDLKTAIGKKYDVDGFYLDEKDGKLYLVIWDEKRASSISMDGELMWSVNLPDGFRCDSEHQFVWPGPCGPTFKTPHGLYALDAMTGVVSWTYARKIEPSTVLSYNDNVIVVGPDFLYEVDLANGNEIWSYKPSHDISTWLSDKYNILFLERFFKWLYMDNLFTESGLILVVDFGDAFHVLRNGEEIIRYPGDDTRYAGMAGEMLFLVREINDELYLEANPLPK